MFGLPSKHSFICCWLLSEALYCGNQKPLGSRRCMWLRKSAVSGAHVLSVSDYYSSFQLLKPNFANLAAFDTKNTNTVHKNTHPNCKIPQISCKMKHGNQNSIIKIKLLHQVAQTSFMLPDFCLTNYTLLGIIRSTHIFSMLCHNTKTVENSSDCLHAQKYLQLHMCCWNICFFIFQVSATYAQQIY